MPYPVERSSVINPGDTLRVPWTPEMAGLVKVIVVASAQLPDRPERRDPDEDPPEAVLLSMRVEVFAPGAAAPVLTRSDHKLLNAPEILNRLILWGDTEATSSSVGGEWIARVTNFGNAPVTCRVTVRYPTVAGNLGKIDHVVILMMENRSFDHMLGYLRVDEGRSDVDGLRGTETNTDDSGHAHQVHPSQSTLFRNDPGHDFEDVREQLGDSNGGFVRNFAKVLAGQPSLIESTTQQDRGRIGAGFSRSIHFRPDMAGALRIRSVAVDPPQSGDAPYLARLVLRRPGRSTPLATAAATREETEVSLVHVVTASDLMAIGDWTCQVINGADEDVTFDTVITYPTEVRPEQEPARAIMGYHPAAHLPAYDYLAREFTICDRWFSSLPTDTWPNRLYALTGGSGGTMETPSGDEVLMHPPGFTLKTIFEILEERGVDWTVYFSDMPFALIFKPLVQDARYTKRMRPLLTFMWRAETGDLPAVSWIDPNFTAVPESDLANDDHPPGDVTSGQRLVAQVYRALHSSPAWSKTLLLITYDEHGGFYDHVTPPGTPPLQRPRPPKRPPDDQYGVRVPAFVVSPWSQRSHVAHDTYDHTSLLRTVLLRFCVGSHGTLPSMGARADAANHVEPLLSESWPRPEIAPLPAAAPSPGRQHFPFASSGFGAILRKALVGF